MESNYVRNLQYPAKPPHRTSDTLEASSNAQSKMLSGEVVLGQLAADLS